MYRAWGAVRSSFTKGCRPSQYTDLFCLPPNPVDTLEMISEVEPPASPAAAGDEPSSKQPVAEGLLTALQPFLSEALVSQVGACYQFNVILPSGTQSIYFLDLTAGMAVPSILPSHSGCLCPLPWSFKEHPLLLPPDWNESTMTTGALASL